MGIALGGSWFGIVGNDVKKSEDFPVQKQVHSLAIRARRSFPVALDHVFHASSHALAATWLSDGMAWL